MIAATGGGNHCERHSHQAFASQAFDRKAFGFQIASDKSFAR